MILDIETVSEPQDTETSRFWCHCAGFLNQRSSANRYSFHVYLYLGESRAKDWSDTYKRWNPD